jgi:ParB family transcriptional regulator, chromosome partitioning protein
MSHEMIQQRVALDKIVIRGQLREQYDDKVVTAMALSMKCIGLLYAILLRLVDGELVIVDGVTRFLASKKLGWTSIPAIIDDREVPEEEALCRGLSANLRRTDFKPLETARGIVRWMKLTGFSATETASRLGMSNAALTRAVSVLSLPEAIAEQVNSGAIPVSTAYAISQVSDPVKQAEMAAAVVAGRLTRDAASGAVKREKNDVAQPKRQSLSRVVADVGSARVTIGAPGLTIDMAIESLKELLAAARKAQSRGVDIKAWQRKLREQSAAHTPQQTVVESAQ